MKMFTCFFSSSSSERRQVISFSEKRNIRSCCSACFKFFFKQKFKMIFEVIFVVSRAKKDEAI